MDHICGITQTCHRGARQLDKHHRGVNLLDLNDHIVHPRKNEITDAT